MIETPQLSGSHHAIRDVEGIQKTHLLNTAYALKVIEF